MLLFLPRVSQVLIYELPYDLDTTWTGFNSTLDISSTIDSGGDVIDRGIATIAAVQGNRRSSRCQPLRAAATEPI